MKNTLGVMTGCALALWLAVAPAPAQNIYGTVLGTIRDSSGATVAGVEVVVTNIETNQPFRAATNESGYYEFNYLKPGPYSLRVSRTGFKTSERARVELSVNDRTRLDFSLEVGDVSTSVSVEDKAPPVQSESASLGQVVSHRTVQEMPVEGRNVFDLAMLVAGVMVNPDAENRYVAEGASTAPIFRSAEAVTAPMNS